MCNVFLSTATVWDVLQVDTILAANLGIHLPNTSSGIVMLTGQASPDAYRQVLATITYENTAEEPVPPGETRQRNVIFLVIDGMFPSEESLATITLRPKNDPPRVCIRNDTVVYDDLTKAAVRLFSTADRIEDTDSTELVWLTLEIISPIDSRDNLSVSLESGLSLLAQSTIAPTNSACFPFAANNTYQFLNISGAAMFASYEQVLHSATFANDCPDLDLSQRIIVATVSDGIITNTVNVSLNITDYDDPPLCYFGDWPVSGQIILYTRLVLSILFFSILIFLTFLFCTGCSKHFTVLH